MRLNPTAGGERDSRDDGDRERNSKSAVPSRIVDPGRATMRADLDLMLTPCSPRLGHLIPPAHGPAMETPDEAGRHARLVDGDVRHDCPSYVDYVVLVDSIPVECGRSVETARGQLLVAARVDRQLLVLLDRLAPDLLRARSRRGRRCDQRAKLCVELRSGR
jgi:hypothetical protein